MRIPKTFEGFCKLKNIDPVKVLPKVSALPKKYQKATIAAVKLYIINEAINYLDNGKKDWLPNWNDFNERKYYPWFDLEKGEDNPSGFRLLDGYYVSTFSGVGSRLVYRNRDHAEFVATHFEPLYRDLMLLD